MWFGLNLVVLGGLGCRPSRGTVVAAPAPEVLLAEGRIVNNTHATVPVKFHGLTMNFIADLGSTMSSINTAVLDSLRIPYTEGSKGVGNAIGPDGSVVLQFINFTDPDSLSIGTFALHNMQHVTISSDDHLSGSFGINSLSNFDLEFDLPAKRMRVYAWPAKIDSAAKKTHVAAWLPHGLTATDCVPASINGPVFESGMNFNVRANGHVFPAMFDNLERRTVITWAAAQALGITAKDVNSGVAQGITLQIGGQSLAAVPIQVVDEQYGNDPHIILGWDSFRDRVFFMSSSTETVCVSDPLRPSGR